MKQSRNELPFWPGFVLIAVVVPAFYWLRYGRIDAFTYGFTGFLLLLALGIQFLPKLGDKYEEDQAAIKVSPGLFDRLGIVWLLAIPFAPFAMWLVGSLWTIDASNWRTVLGIKAFLCVAVPVVCVLPLVRYVRGKAAPYAMLFLFLGTAFPVSVGWASASDFIRGPHWEAVVVTDVKRIYGQYKMRDFPTPILDVRLSDGRELQANSNVSTPKEGAANVLVLDSLGLILGLRS